MSLVQEGKREAYVTDLTVDSVLIVLENKGRKPPDMRLFLSSVASWKAITIYFLALSDRLRATRIMEESNLDYEDSTVAQVARRLSVDGVISFDKDLDRVEGIRVLNQDLLFDGETTGPTVSPPFPFTEGCGSIAYTCLGTSSRLGMIQRERQQNVQLGMF